MLNDLELVEKYKQHEKAFDGNKIKSMTAAMVGYLVDEFPEEADELKFVIQKARNYLTK